MVLKSASGLYKKSKLQANSVTSSPPPVLDRRRRQSGEVGGKAAKGRPRRSGDATLTLVSNASLEMVYNLINYLSMRDIRHLKKGN